MKSPAQVSFRRSSAVLAMLTLVTLSACGKGTNKNPKIDGVEGPHVSFVDNKFLMTVVLTKLELPGGVRLPIQAMPNSYVEVGPDFQSNGTLIAAGLDVADLKALSKDNFKLLDPLFLPGGRPLPGVVDGYLPAIAVEVPKLKNVVFYFGPEVLGAFVPVPLLIEEVIASHRFYDAAGDRIGTISVVGTDKALENSGFLVLVDIKGKVKTLMNGGRL